MTMEEMAKEMYTSYGEVTNVNDAAVLALKQLVQEQQRDALERAVTTNALRAKLAQLENATSEMACAAAENEAPLLALNEITDYLIERTRVERDACGEPGLWARTPLGNSVALTLYQDLCTKLDKIRMGYGV